MIIKDFDRQIILSPAQIAALVNALPNAHLRGLQTLMYKPARELWQLHIPIDNGCKGAFYPEFLSIIIFDLVDKSLGPHIIYHEIGHYVFHRIINSYVRKEWVSTIFNPATATSDYGRKNAIEDFAETYAVYARDPATLLKLPAKHRFMRNIFSLR